MTSEVNPRTETYNNLIKATKLETSAGTEVIIVMDANDNIKSRQTDISILMNQLQMVSVHSNRHGSDVPPTSKGQHQIYFILPTKGIARYVTAAGICPPGTP